MAVIRGHDGYACRDGFVADAVADLLAVITDFLVVVADLLAAVTVLVAAQRVSTHSFAVVTD